VTGLIVLIVAYLSIHGHMAMHPFE